MCSTKNNELIHIIPNIGNLKILKDSYVYTMPFSGLSKNDINVVVDNQGLIGFDVVNDITINSYRYADAIKLKKGEKYRFSGFEHPTADMYVARYDYDKPIKAVLSKGVLTITVPRKDCSYVVDVT